MTSNFARNQERIEQDMMNLILDRFVLDLGGIPIGLFEQGIGRFSAHSKDAFSGFCGLMTDHPEGNRLCTEDHACRALECKTHDITMCHMGLFNASYPITHDNTQVGTLLAGQRRIKDLDDKCRHVFEERLAALNWSDDFKTRLRSAFDEVPVVDQDVFDHAIFSSLQTITSYYIYLRTLRLRFIETAINLLHDLGIPTASLSSLCEKILRLSYQSTNSMDTAYMLQGAARRLIGQCDLLNMCLDNYDGSLASGENRLFAEPLYLDSILSDTIEAMIDYADDKHVSLKPPKFSGWHTPKEDIRFRGSATLIRRAFMNVFHNAVKYSYRGDTIKRFRYVRTDVSRITEASFTVRISSYGVPIEASELGHIFEAGYRGSHARVECEAGSGLGLAEVKRIIELHGGSVDMKSTDAGGPHLNIITVVLPFKPKRGTA